MSQRINLQNTPDPSNIEGGPEAAAGLIAASDAAASSNDPAVLVAASTTDDSAPMYQAPYYTEEDRGRSGHPPSCDESCRPTGATSPR